MSTYHFDGPYWTEQKHAYVKVNPSRILQEEIEEWRCNAFVKPIDAASHLESL